MSQEIVSNQLVRVSKSGRVGLFDSLLKRWDMFNGGELQIHDFGALILVSTQENTERLEMDKSRYIGSCLVSNGRNFVLTKDITRRWGLAEGGDVLFGDLRTTVTYVNLQSIAEMAKNNALQRELLGEISNSSAIKFD